MLTDNKPLRQDADREEDGLPRVWTPYPLDRKRTEKRMGNPYPSVRNPPKKRMQNPYPLDRKRI